MTQILDFFRPNAPSPVIPVEPLPTGFITPEDWPSFVAAPNNVNLLITDHCYPALRFMVTTAGAVPFTVNWGDGLTQSFASGTTVLHIYTIGAGTPCSEGYTTFLCNITSAGDILVFKTVKPLIVSSGNLIAPILAADINCPLLTTCFYMMCATGYPPAYLKTIVFPATMNETVSFEHCLYEAVSLEKVQMPSSMNKVTTFNEAFYGCYILETVAIPVTPLVTTFQKMFYTCRKLKEISFPSSYPVLTNMNETFYGCFSLTDVTFPNNMPELTQMYSCFYDCSSLEQLLFPATVPKLTTISNMFKFCYNLKAIELGEMPLLTTMDFAFGYCRNLKTITFPSQYNALLNMDNTFYSCTALVEITLPNLPAITSISQTFSACNGLRAINNINSLVYAAGFLSMEYSYSDCFAIQSLTIGAKLSVIKVKGYTGQVIPFNSLRLTNPLSTFLGGTPAIDVSYTSLSTAALVLLFQDLPTVSAKQIKITLSTGAAGLSAADRLIATSKGWTISG